MAWISLVFFVATVAGALSQSLPGGYGETNFVTPYVRQVVFSVKGDIVSRLIDLGIRVYDFEPLFYRGRVAAGTGYLVKIRIDYGQYIHASIFRHLSGSTEVLDIEVGKSLADPLV
ncbi:cystatin-A-like [Crassostrea virginica]